MEDQGTEIHTPILKRLQSEIEVPVVQKLELPADSYVPTYHYLILGLILVFLMSFGLYKDYKLNLVTDMITQQNMVLIQHQQYFESMNQ
jgi:hypothetical protein